MKSLIVKRSIAIAGHKTSVSLEDSFWNGLKEIAAQRGVTLSDMVATIDTERPSANLSSTLRLFVLDHYRTMVGSAAAAPGSRAETAVQNPSSALSTRG